MTRKGHQLAALPLLLQQGLQFAMKLRREPAAVAVRIGVAGERSGEVGSLPVPLHAKASPLAAQ